MRVLLLFRLVSHFTWVYFLRHVTGVIRLDEDDVNQLSREIDVALESGVKNRKPLLKLIEKFKFTYEIYRRKLGEDPSYVFSMSDEIMKSLREAIKIRDRLMHPKLHNDLLISDNELETLTNVGTWFVHINAASMQFVISKLEERNRFMGRNKNK